MRELALFVLFLFFACANVEDRIKDHSYTTIWYYENEDRYQVYQTKKGDLYIIVLNRAETKFKRKYIKINKNI